MRENPNPDLPDDLQTFKGDNWVKHTGDAQTAIQMEAFMLEANQVINKQKELGPEIIKT